MRLSAVLVAVLMTGCAAAGGAPQPAAPSPAPSLAEQLQFDSGARCDPGREALCAVVELIPWTDGERSRVRQLVRGLEQESRARRMVAAFVSSPANRLVQTRYGFDFSPAGAVFRSNGNPAWVMWNQPAATYLTHELVSADVQRDVRSGFDVRQLIVLHEFAHAYDDAQRISTRPDFATAMIQTLSLVDQGRCQAINRAFQTTAVSNYWLAWANQRDALRTPSVQDAVGALPSVTICLRAELKDRWLQEVYADFASAWILDPTAALDFPPPARLWFLKNLPR